MLEKVRLALRQKNAVYDDEILDLIEACKIDLKIAGVNKINEADLLTKRAIILYCKGSFGYDDNSEKFMQSYTKLKIAMALSGDYGDDENV